MIACQQKIIKVADRSDYGWAVVKAYDNDELASDSEDEKRLFKAALFIQAHWELTPFSTTLCRRLCRKQESHLNMLPSIPYDFILLNNFS